MKQRMVRHKIEEYMEQRELNAVLGLEEGEVISVLSYDDK